MQMSRHSEKIYIFIHAKIVLCHWKDDPGGTGTWLFRSLSPQQAATTIGGA